MTVPDYRREPARRALKAWSAFPAERQHRPLVMLSSVTRPGGFRTGEEKMAFLRGAIEAGPGFPPDVLRVMHGEPGDHDVPPLMVTTAVKGSTEFCTDRGRRQLPAWKVHARDVPEPIWVLDAAIIQQTCWPPDREVPVWQGITATLEPDGRTLTMFFPGGPAAWMQYPTAEVLESGGALALIPLEVITGPTRTGEGPWSCSLEGHAREVTVILARALGHRVLLDQVGSPVMVSPAGDPARPAPASC
jgi:hypothetical protein